MMKNHVPCLEPGCKTEYGLDVLKVKRMLPCPIQLITFILVNVGGTGKADLQPSREEASSRRDYGSWDRRYTFPSAHLSKSVLFIFISLGLESCPFCDYAQVPRDTDKLFECQNPECQQVSCRACREANHLPLRCEEHAMKQRLSNYVEAKMTEALLRECPSCKTKFVKSDGCNKMVI